MAEGDVVADGLVNAEKLAQLLALGAEQEELDFKATLDPSSPRDKVEIVKHLLAMMSLSDGGYLVVGVDGSGRPATDQRPIEPARFDSAALLQLVRSYVNDAVDVRSAIHFLDSAAGKWPVSLIYAGPPPQLLPLIVTKLGEVQGPGKPKVILRPGQVIVREGTTTTELGVRHWPRLLARYRLHVKSEAQADINALVRRVVESTQIPTAGSTLPIIDIAMELDTYREAADTVVENGSRVQLAQVWRAASTHFGNSRRARDLEGVSQALDRITVLLQASLEFGPAEQFEELMMKFAELYREISDTLARPGPDEPSHIPNAVLWREVAVRLYVLGAYAVRLRKWSYVRSLTLRPYSEGFGWDFVSWIRHGLTYAYRAGVLDEVGRAGGALIARARRLSGEHQALRPDLPNYELSADDDSSDSDVLLNSLCQFDFLWCVIANVESKNGDQDFYPSSAFWHQTRVDPIIGTIASDPQMRLQAFDEHEDREIADAMSVVLHLAKAESHKSGGWWGDLPHSAEQFMANNS